MKPRSSQSQGFLRMQQHMKKFFQQASRDIPQLEGTGTKSLEAWFLGAKGENADELERLIVEAIRDQAFWRKNYHSGDPSYIPESVKISEDYIQTMAKLKDNYYLLLAFLKKSVPFFSMRYQGHMCWDITLPSILGYFAAMLYNSNNVAFEVSTATTYLEMLVGDDLCQMLGYRIPTEEDIEIKGAIRPWGHVTSGGTVANIEALWSARNLKFYPLTFKAALLDDRWTWGDAKNIKIDLPNGDRQPLISLNVWQLLNLQSDEILKLPARLNNNYGIDSEILSQALAKYSLQNLGFLNFSRRFLAIDPEDKSGSSIGDMPIYIVPGSKHYSWPKAGAILGLGQDYGINIPVDADGRMKVSELETLLDRCLNKKQPVITVVAVIGSTEESSIDPIQDIIALREKFRKKGLEFTIHADAAWGGYHASVIRDDFILSTPNDLTTPETTKFITTDYIMLSQYATHQFLALHQADSITVDPHKSGYIPYPAGALCYRNSAMRDLVTFKAPVIFHGETEPTVGIYGIEGSKPGAAPASIYLSHKVIRPTKSGYGQIINKALYGCKKLYARLLCMAQPEDSFLVAPVPRLPAEIANKSNVEIEAQRQLIATAINGKTYEEIMDNPEAKELLPEIGPDQNILLYAFNFKDKNGEFNRDLDAANQFNKQLYELLSINPGEDIYSYNLIVSTTDLTTSYYGADLMQSFGERLLGKGSGVNWTNPNTSITVIRSVSMDPWLTETSEGSFIDVLEEEFRNAVQTILSSNMFGQLFFGVLDKDKSETIDRSEIELELQQMGYNQENIDRFWRMADVDGDESLSLSEFVSKWQQLL